MQSFGDDTLSACMRAENNLNIIREESDINKYFKESMIFPSNTANQFEQVNSPGTSQVHEHNKTKLNSPSNTTKPLLQNQSKCASANQSNLRKLKITYSDISNTKRIRHSVPVNKIANHKILEKENLLKIDIVNRTQASIKVHSDETSKSILTQHKTENSKSIHASSIRNTGNSIKDTTNNALSHSGTPIGASSYLSTIPTQDRCKLAVWGLPPNVLEKYEARGVSSMFPWQVECLSNHKIIEERCNLVYSAPTSAGKTLVAEILIVKTVLETRKKVIFILPFVSVVREKMYYFQDLLSDSGIRVEGFMGGISPVGGFAATHVAIATIEKANSLINRLMEEDELINLGAVVIDELHLVGDPHRGYLLELLLTKLKYMTLRNENIRIQLIGMSATLPNLSLLAEWLNAELYKTDFRPIPLKEQCKIGTCIYDNKLGLVRELEPMIELSMDSDNVLQLCIETISDGHSILIFCPTKNWCEKLSEQIAFTFYKLGHEDTDIGRMLRQQLNAELISETLEQLKRSPIGLDTVLRNTVSFGVAFHHAGLTMDERDILEGAFRSGSLRILVATSTLSSGVNLPARRVLIRTPIFGGKVLDSLTYKQMIGRAGRMGKDTAGESILICKNNERKAAESLLSATLNPIESCLEDSTPLIRALLEAVASEVVYTPEDVDTYAQCTLISMTEGKSSRNPANEAIEFLVDNEFLLLQKTEEEHRWVATALGKACLAASIPPRDGLYLLEELQKARRCFVLDTELHVIYLVTPIHSGSQISTIDWMTFMELWKALSESERRVGQLVGVEERFLTSAMTGVVRSGKLLSIHRRFYTALALHDLVRETSLGEVCKKYGCSRGVLQSLQQTASTFAGMVTQFCKQLGWDCMELLVSQFQARLQFGVCRELLDLLRLPMLNGLRARSLYKQGITTVAELALANELDVERALYKALPFESEKGQDGEHENDAQKRNKMRTVFVTGKDGLTPHEAAVMLVQEARALVQNELKLQDMQWDNASQSSGTNASESSTTMRSHIRQNTFESIKSTTPKESYSLSSRSIVSEKSQKEKSRSQNVRTSNIIRYEENRESMTEIGERAKSNSASGVIDIQSINTEHVTKPIENPEIGNVQKLDDHIEKPSERTLLLDRVNLLECSIRKTSLDFFDDSSFNLKSIEEPKRTSESLLSSKLTQKSHKKSVTINTTEVIRKPDSFDGTPKKILKTDSQNANNKELSTSNSILARMTLNIDAQTRISGSPDLFDDSFNIDTQVCNILEQNIIDTLEFSDFNEIKSLEPKLPPPASKINTKTNKTSKSNANVQYETNTNRHVPTKENSLLWKDDSWNEPQGVMNKLKLLNEKNTENTPVKYNVRNIKNINKSQIIETPKSSSSRQFKSCDMRVKKSVTLSDDFKKVPQSQRFKDVLSEGSPIANVIVLDRKRTASLDSTKSDADDIVIPSQSTETPLTMKLRSMRNSTKIAKKQASKVLDRIPGTVAKEIFAKENTFLKEEIRDSSLNNIDSAEDTPTKMVNAIQEPKVPLIKSRPSDEDCRICNENTEITPWTTLDVIKVGSDRGTFNLFKREVMSKKYLGLALSCEEYTNDTNIIGSKVISSVTGERKTRSKKTTNFVHENKKLCGVSICWENNTAYYVSFSNTPESKITGKEQLKLLKELLENSMLYVKCFATKETFCMLYQCCEISANCRFLDPKIASWLRDSNAHEKSFNELVAEHCPQGRSIMKRMGSCYDTGPGLNVRSQLPGELRASAETVLTWHITDALLDKLEKLSPTLLYTFKEVEMRTIISLACMELTGFRVSLKSLQDLATTIRNEMVSLEERAYTLAGKKFNFSSSKEVAEVLGLYKGKKVSVNKGVLEHIDHPIASLVMSWRKLSATQSKMVYPLLNQAQHNSRIHGHCVTCTVTGRVSMHEPNLQNVPKDFNSVDNSFVISVRMAFVPAVGNVILAADYCQLELRILAHFSKDATLCSIMRKPGDIFKSVAAAWHHVPEEQVDDQMRQHTKQLCYGMIYGMGVKSLAESLCVDETRAKEFLESFMNTYPGIRQWLDNILDEARKNGYVTSILERRRLLPGLLSTNLAEKSQAERQAVNTKIQGSAADIAKKAMVNIEDRMRYEFPNRSIIMPTVQSTRKLRSGSTELQQRGGHLVLQLHDELLYEVNIKDVREVAIIVKESMEHVCHLAVPLPVKIKVGPVWGDLSEYNFQ